MPAFTLDEIGYGDLPDTAPTGPRSLQDMGYDVLSGSGEKLQSPEERGAYPEEEQAIRDYVNSQPDERSWSEIASDTAQNIGDAVSYIAPTALGGEGKFRISEMPGAIWEGIKGGVMAPRRLMSGEVPMYDANGYPRQEAIAEALKFDSLYMPSGRGVRPGSLPLSATEAAARRRIANAIADDQNSGRTRGIRPNSRSQFGPRMLPGATPEQLSALNAEGVPVSAYDLSGGPSMKGLVERSSDAAHDTAHARTLQQDIANRSAHGGEYVASTIDQIAGRPLETGAEFDAAVSAIKDTNSVNYPAIMAMPEHRSLFSPRLKSILEERPVVARVIRDLDESIRNTGDLPPAIYDRSGRLNIQPANGPSLEYLNTVYKRVREAAEKAYDNGDVDDGGKLKKAANDLRDELDNLSAKNASGEPLYKEVRDVASDLFGARNALDAGYKYLSNAAPLKMDEINRAVSQYTPDQVAQMRTGLLAKLKDDVLKPNGLAKVTSYFDGSNPQIQARIARILGSDTTDRLGNQMRLQKIVGETEAPVLSPEAAAKAGGMSRTAALGIGAAGALGVVGAEKLLENLPMITAAASGPVSGTVAATAGAAAAAFGLKKIISGARNAYEARVAQHVLDYVTTRDPAAFAALERLPPGAVRSILDKVTRKSVPVAAGAAGAALDDNTGEPATFVERPGRKAGGRVQGNPISAEVKKVRALLSHRTATMLSMPDDAVATALHIAKGK